mmetsp:Transcript_6066/g.22195  ORF Transcript_6066/g.22195 Transcript_6066/m.22195 type:complete len:227 (+) Transcript_6066:792-1472(+)
MIDYHTVSSSYGTSQPLVGVRELGTDLRERGHSFIRVVRIRVPRDVARVPRLVEHRVARHQHPRRPPDLLRRRHREVVLLLRRFKRVADRAQLSKFVVRLVHLRLIQRQLRDHVVRLLGEDVQLRRIGHGEVCVQFDSRRLSVAELLPYSVLRDRVERRRGHRGGLGSVNSPFWQRTPMRPDAGRGTTDAIEDAMRGRRKGRRGNRAKTGGRCDRGRASCGAKAQD